MLICGYVAKIIFYHRLPLMHHATVQDRKYPATNFYLLTCTTRLLHYFSALSEVYDHLITHFIFACQTFCAAIGWRQYFWMCQCHICRCGGKVCFIVPSMLWKFHIYVSHSN